MLKNKIIALFSLTMLILPVYAEDVQNTVIQDEQVVETVNTDESIADKQNTTENFVETDQSVQDISNQAYKQPVSKRKIAKKFLFAMLGVVVSSVLIFVILSIYNKIRDNFIKGEPLSSQDGENSLESPEDLTESIKSFLNKTKWE